MFFDFNFSMHEHSASDMCLKTMANSCYSLDVLDSDDGSPVTGLSTHGASSDGEYEDLGQSYYTIPDSPLEDSHNNPLEGSHYETIDQKPTDATRAEERGDDEETEQSSPRVVPVVQSIMQVSIEHD